MNRGDWLKSEWRNLQSASTPDWDFEAMSSALRALGRGLGAWGEVKRMEVSEVVPVLCYLYAFCAIEIAGVADEDCQHQAARVRDVVKELSQRTHYRRLQV